MFETAELGQTISKADYKERIPVLRELLLEAQQRIREAEFPLLILFAGVDGAGKGESANRLNEWLDARWVSTRAYATPSEAERQRPEYWRFWRDLPPRGSTSILLSAWYSRPLLHHAFGKIDDAELERRLARIVQFERALVDDGAMILKFWMHLGRAQQKRRLKDLEADKDRRWRVSKRDWKHWRMYEEFVDAAERIIMRTSTGPAPWMIVEGADERFRNLKVANTLLDEVTRRLERTADHAEQSADPSSKGTTPTATTDTSVPVTTVLSRVDLNAALERADYRARLQRLQGRLNRLHRKARARGVSTILVFEGWDAAGKGGAIRRIIRALDARDYQVIRIAAPTDEEKARHYLWRFWRHLPDAGRFTIYDRSWYGRVLVERVEGFAQEHEWRRAYAEINHFEKELTEHGIVILKFWIHISPDEQERRFAERQRTPYKRWKLTDEDWRNREQWDAYEAAMDDVVERTSTRIAPWHLIAGNDKRHARIQVLETVCDGLRARLDR